MSAVDDFVLGAESFGADRGAPVAAQGAPTLASVSVESGPWIEVGTQVLVEGTNLLGLTSLTFDGAEATSVEVLSSTQVRCLLPAAAPGTVADVVATTSQGSDTLVGGVTYQQTWDALVSALAPYAWWKLHENTTPPAASNAAADASGNGRPGLYVGDTTPTRFIAGPQLFGVDPTYGVQAVAGRNIRDNSLTVGTLMADDWSIALWIKGNLAAAGNIMRRVSSYDGFSVWLNYRASTSSTVSGWWSFYADTTGSDGNAIEANLAWNDNQWHHVALTFDRGANEFKIYKDGVLVVTDSFGGTLGAPDNQHEWLGLAASSVTGTQVSQYLFFDRVVSGAEWTALLTAGDV